jgi:NAD(P)-dependent dehydrogenase (short-subunit alcohol dehydrogenase family)
MSAERKTVLITGANRGIGFALAEIFLQQDYNVIATARDPAKASELTQLGAKHAGRLRIEPLDVEQPQSIAALGQKLASTPIDILVNNAGIAAPKLRTTVGADVDSFAKTFETNTFGPLRMAQALLEPLRKACSAAGIAKIATISSAMGSMSHAAPDYIAYRASKAAVNKIMQGLATELSPEKIAVYILHPGWVRTDMGGAGADIDVAMSARGLYQQIAARGMAETGSFTDYAGKVIAW